MPRLGDGHGFQLRCLIQGHCAGAHVNGSVGASGLCRVWPLRRCMFESTGAPGGQLPGATRHSHGLQP